MARAEPCPVIGCLDFKARGLIVCRRHWRMLDPRTRGRINTLWAALSSANRAGDKPLFRQYVRAFIEARRQAVAELYTKEHIDVVSV